MSLECKSQCLQHKLEDAEEALQKAAQYGLQLLNDKLDLQTKLEEQRTELTAVIEVKLYLNNFIMQLTHTKYPTWDVMSN